MQLCWKVPWSLGNYSSQACRVETSGKDLGKMWSFQTTPTPAKSFRSTVTTCIYVMFMVCLLFFDILLLIVGRLGQECMSQPCFRIAMTAQSWPIAMKTVSKMLDRAAPMTWRYVPDFWVAVVPVQEVSNTFSVLFIAHLFRDYSNLIDILCSQSAVSGG